MNAKTKLLLIQNWNETVVPAIEVGMKKAKCRATQIKAVINRLRDAQAVKPGPHFDCLFQTDQAVADAVQKAMQEKVGADFKMDAVKWSFVRSHVGAVSKRLSVKEKRKKSKANDRTCFANIIRIHGFDAVAKHIENESDGSVCCPGLSAASKEIVSNLRVYNVTITTRQFFEQLKTWGVTVKADSLDTLLAGYSVEEVLRALRKKTPAPKLVGIIAKISA